MSFDFAIIGIVFALILLVIFFSAVVLYLSFRIKETFRKETRRGSTIVKIAFLIGILFLAGGMFYFFTNTLTNINEPAPTQTPAPTTSPLPTTTQSLTPTPAPTISPSPTTSPSPTPKPTPTPTPSSTLELSLSYPPTVKMNNPLTLSFTISNPTLNTAKGAVLQTNVLFSSFTLQSSTHNVVGNVINIGDIPSGITLVSLELVAPDRPQTVTDTIALVFPEMIGEITETLNISVRGSGQ